TAVGEFDLVAQATPWAGNQHHNLSSRARARELLLVDERQITRTLKRRPRNDRIESMCPRVRTGAFFVDRTALAETLERECGVERMRLIVRDRPRVHVA